MRKVSSHTIRLFGEVEETSIYVDTECYAIKNKGALGRKLVGLGISRTRRRAVKGVIQRAFLWAQWILRLQWTVASR